MFWTELPTPAAIVDLDRLEANTARISERVEKLGARLRPHVKTHKTVEAARFQVRGHFGGITVSTLAEARFFGRAGFRDITYAVPIAPQRLGEAIELARSLDALHLLVDHEATFGAMEAAAKANGVRLSTFLKVDCGYHRAGVDPESEDSVALALRLSRSPHVDFAGILTHAGHSYDAKSAEDVRRVAATEREVMVRFGEKLRRAGAPPPVVSVGSTPTVSLGESLEGIDEVRPGNYVFYDRFQATIGSCGFEDPAFSVLVTVLGQYPERNELLIDAGALAFSKDPGPTHVDPGCGYGAVFSADGVEHHRALKVRSISQEHGKVQGSADAPIDFGRFSVGTRLRVVPNHSCLTAALFERYHVVREDRVVDEWRPVRGW
jgi:D-serine deaminase-like pyridoxal phosphate-dependent protein